MTDKLFRMITCLAMLLASQAYAREYPSKVINLIVPFTAGGPTDTVARLLGRPMGASLRGQVIVENADGAGGTVGAARVAKASPARKPVFTLTDLNCCESP